MVAPLLVGGGLSLAGGIANAIGGRKQADAQMGASQQGLDAARGLKAANQRNYDYTSGQMQPFVGQQNEQMGGLINAFGPAQREALTNALPGVQSALQGADQQIQGMMRPTYNPAGGVGSNVAHNQQAALQARMAPGQALQQLQMQHAAMRPEIASQRSGVFDAMGTTGREAGGVMSDFGLRQALANQQFGGDINAAQMAMQNAGYEGRGLQAVGQFAQGLAPGITTAWAANQPTGAPGAPPPLPPMQPGPGDHMLGASDLYQPQPMGGIQGSNVMPPIQYPGQQMLS